MSLRLALLGFVWLTATGARAEERGGAPLESTKQELKTLQADEAARGNGTATGKLTDGLPQLSSPLPGAVPLEITSPRQMEKELKQRKEARKNWLIDGVDKLEKEARSNGREKNEAKDSVSEEMNNATDQTTSDYELLPPYEQNQQTRAKDEVRRADSVRSDPLAPFLQGWLVDSPGRDKFLDEFVKKTDGSVGPIAASEGRRLPDQGLFGVRGEVSSSARNAGLPTVRPNPYLLGSDLPSLSDLGASRSAAATANPALAASGGAPPAAAWSDPTTNGRLREKKLPLLGPTDAQKYFPQQKKF